MTIKDCFVKFIGVTVCSLGAIQVHAAGVCSKKLIVGFEVWEPYNMKIDGKTTGIDIDILDAVSKKIGCTFEFRELAWKRHLKEMEEGTVDIAMGSSKTAERENIFLFSKTYREENVSMFIKEGSSLMTAITKLDQLKTGQFKIGTVNDYSYGDTFDGYMKDKEFLKNVSSVSADALNFKKLAEDRIQIALADKFTGVFTIKTLLDKKEISSKFVLHPVSISVSPIYFMFSKKTMDAKIVDAVNKAIQELIKEKKIESILKKYLF